MRGDEATRRDRGIDPANVDPDPIAQFGRWLDEAFAAGIREPVAMVLATVDPEGRPAARYVLLRGVDERGFVFHTNRRSAKGIHLAANPVAALTFGWLELQRSVRIAGTVSLLSDDESDAYFATRDRASQLSAWASAQSTTIESRDVLEASLAEVEARFAGQPVLRPPHWGGYRVRPDAIELWQGRAHRRHDRVRYVRTAEDGWRIERLSP